MTVSLFNCTEVVQLKSITVLYDSYSTVMQLILYEKYSMLLHFDPFTQSITFYINFNYVAVSTKNGLIAYIDKY